MNRAWLLPLVLSLGVACSERAPRQAALLIDVPRNGGLDQIEWSPREAVARVRRYADRFELEIDRARPGDKLVVDARGRCKGELDLTGLRAGERRTLELPRFLSASGGDMIQLGFDAPFAITLTPGCREALGGKVEWRQVEGAALDLQIENNGFVLKSRTRGLEAERPWGIVPISPRSRGQYVFEASFVAGARREQLKVRVASAARATGIPSIALGQRVFLGGHGWSVKTPAKGGAAQVQSSGGLVSFQPDARGRWLLVDAEQRELSLSAGTHTETPLDCGRSDCHAKETKRAAETEMTTILFRSYTGKYPSLPNECAIACHTTGEPGLADGGFDHVRRDFGLEGVLPANWDTLPRPLRRLGGVTCTACHGPSAIPEPSARWAILRADVCAFCHDAPPEYSHVVAWRRSRMARADRDTEARTKAECRRCHTTTGFLADQKLREDKGGSAADIAFGIGCAACHAPHGAHLAELVRDVPRPKDLANAASGPSSICLPCHALGAARIIVGGKAPPHVAAPGCMRCHGRPPGKEKARGEDHDFRALETSCTLGCHEAGAPRRDPGLRDRALRLFTRLGAKPASERPPHAGPSLVVPKDEASALDDVLAVLEDPAADVHNPAYAKELLDRAEVALDGRH